MSAYSLSRYNHYLRYGSGGDYLVYNALSNGLAKINSEVYAALRRGDAGLESLDSERLNALRSGQIIVEKDLDELGLLKSKLNIARFGSRALSLTIIPTLGCNMACAYCYEGLRSEITHMDEATEEAIVAFAKAQIAHFGYKMLTVSWFGGEPLMRPQILYSLSRKLVALCRKEHVAYRATVVTNGTNLNKAIARKLKTYLVSNIQVTIDGPKDVHDARRPFKEGTKSSFDTIVRNVERVLGIVRVEVRINVDRTNHEKSLELVDQMRAKGWLERKGECGFYIGYTRVWTAACAGIADQCFTMQEYSKAELEFQKDLLSRGIKLGNLYPGRTSYCSAASPNGFVVGPRGELYKCWADVNDAGASVGNVRNPVQLGPKLLKWLNYDPLEAFPRCRACGLFPICTGGCPDAAMKSKDGNQNNCTPWKILMKKKIDVFLEQLAANQPQVGTEDCGAASRATAS